MGYCSARGQPCCATLVSWHGGEGWGWSWVVMAAHTLLSQNPLLQPQVLEVLAPSPAQGQGKAQGCRMERGMNSNGGWSLCATGEHRGISEHTGNAGILRRMLWRLGCLIHSTGATGTRQFVVRFFLPAFRVCFLEELLFPGEE